MCCRVGVAGGFMNTPTLVDEIAGAVLIHLYKPFLSMVKVSEQYKQIDRSLIPNQLAKAVCPKITW